MAVFTRNPVKSELRGLFQITYTEHKTKFVPAISLENRFVI